MIVSLFLASILSFVIPDYIFCVINEQKFNINVKKILWILISTIFCLLTSYIFPNIPKSLVIIFCAFLMFHHMYRKTFSKTILSVFLIYILMMISETIFALIFVYKLNIGASFFRIDVLGVFLANLIPLSITIIIFQISNIQNVFKNIITWYEDNRKLKLITVITVAFGLIAFFTYQNYVGAKSLIYLLEVNVILIAIFVFVIGFFKEHAENNKLLIEYDRQLIYVKTYEKLANDKSKNQHEYRNQLSLIKSMVESHDKKIISYIDDLLKIDEQNKAHQYFDHLIYIPSGGLKGFLLFKINEMITSGIEVLVNVDEELKNENCWEICDSELKDVSRAIGVYLDNAKDAAAASKRKFVIIDVSLENETIIFTFSNTFSGTIDFMKLGQDGYSTKGNGHGHGLALIKDIIEKNVHLEQSKQINGIYYVQNLIVK